MSDQVFVLELRALPWSVIANNRGKSFKPDKLREFQKAVATMIRPHVAGFTGPVKLDVLLVFARGKERAKQAQKRGECHEWHTVKPDRDNCLKAIQDALKSIWPDDCCVVDGVTAKIWGKKDAIMIRIGPADPVEDIVEWFQFKEKT